ncbi:hypothetical protein [Arthrobacter sp. RIT-PI-e]|uniref:hypothetical protein n=1 Tax=Arthrobacter sp. RIT-PI-e TaxID=1681197 RepID=UPI0006768A99|nr:hypothetical protein [Arthrobacter sp. RIT-PI-e]
MTADDRTTPAARSVRGWLCAAVATFLAAASHAVAGGSVPLLAVVLSTALGALVCVLLAGRRLTTPRVVLGVLASQLSFHALFEVFSAAPLPAVGDAGPHQHEVAGALLPTVTTATGSGMTALMAVSHLCAGLLTVLLVLHGESLWWSLLGILTAALVVIVHLVAHRPPVYLRRVRPSAEPSPALYELLHRDTRFKLRGPPRWEPSLT